MSRNFIPRFYECRGHVITAAEFERRLAEWPAKPFTRPGEADDWVPMTQAEMDAESARVQAKWAKQAAADQELYRRVRADVARLAALPPQQRR